MKNTEKKTLKIAILIASVIILIGTIAIIVLTTDRSEAQEPSTEIATVKKDIVSVDEDGTVRDAVTGKELTKEEIKDLTEKGVIEKTEDGTVKVNEEKNSQTITVTTDEKGDIIEAKTESGKDVTTTAKENETEYTTTKSTTEAKTEATKTESTTELTTEKKTESTIEKKTESTTEEKKTESTTEATTEKKTESTTEKTTEKKTTESTTERTTEETTEKTTEKKETTTESTTEAKTEHTHKYNLVNTVDATCTTDGKKTYKCSCGDSYTETIPSKGHSWGAEYEVLVGEVPCYEDEIHFIGYNGVDLTTTYGIWTYADWCNYPWDENNPEDGGGFTTDNVPKLIGTSKVYNVYHKCTNCNLEEFLYEK